MGTSAYSTLFHQCAPELPGVPSPQLVHALNDAAIKLCQNTGIWREDQSILLQSGEPD